MSSRTLICCIWFATGNDLINVTVEKDGGEGENEGKKETEDDITVMTRRKIRRESYEMKDINKKISFFFYLN